MKTTAALAVMLATTLVSVAASANSLGLGGFTGRPSASAPKGESCSECHVGGPLPQVSLNGPSTLAAGEQATYTFVVTTGLPRAAAGIAASPGVVLQPAQGGGLAQNFDELVQSSPQTPQGGSTTFTFLVTAPTTGSAMKLWAVGVAANNAGGASGDGTTHTSRDITITGGSAPPDAGAPPGSGDGGSKGGAGGGDGGSNKAGEGDEEDDDGNTSSRGRNRYGNLGPGDGESCAMRPNGGSRTAHVGTGALVLFGWLVRRRVRRH